MLIICDEDELSIMLRSCNGDCGNCVFNKVRCPIEYNMVITDKEIHNGKELEVKYW